MTLRAIAKNNKTGIKMKSRIFFDLGADSMYAIKRVKNLLHLELIGTKNLQVATFLNETLQNLKTETVKFNIRLELDTEFKLLVTADIVKTYLSSTHHMRLMISKLDIGSTMTCTLPIQAMVPASI